ncbi:MAG: TraR/DksA C4-type zinc finger protein [Phycisphaerae bacterium]|nr:TraR/DksA C4-type zinc finger protein [Phycisphaerae bacterium]MDD5380257.1 TraR/DksA C4-type zinc finger protein [Phycisphaerae bacterium]
MSKERKSKTNLTPDEIKKFKALLLAKRDEILNNVTHMEDETLRKQRSDLSNMPIHLADAGSDTFELENTLGLVGSERKLLQEIHDALDRIENKTYGICEGEGGPIAKVRLKAIPWARYCVKCASLSEKGLLAREEPQRDSDYGRISEEQDDNFDNITDEQNND